MDVTKSHTSNAVVLHSIISCFAPELISKRAILFTELIRDCEETAMPKVGWPLPQFLTTPLLSLSLSLQYKLYVSLGNCIVQSNPPQKDHLPLLNNVMHYSSVIVNSISLSLSLSLAAGVEGSYETKETFGNTHSLTHTHTHTLTHSPVHSPTYLQEYIACAHVWIEFVAKNFTVSTHTHTHSPTHPLSYSHTHSPTHPSTHPPTHSLTHPLTHSLTHPLTHPLTLSVEEGGQHTAR